MKRVLLTESIHPDGLSYLRDRFEVEIAPNPHEDTLVSHVADKDALIVRSSPITQKVIEAGKRLKVIGRHGAGVDNIDIAAAAKAGILIVNTPDANGISVAEHALAVMLYLSKGLKRADRAMREGVFDRPGSLPGIVTRLGYTTLELEEKVLGIVGMGRIGQMVAQKCIQSFHMCVLGFDKYTPPDVMRGIGVLPCASLEAIFRQSDMISVHVPLTPETRDLIGAEELALMKPSAFLINTSRGGVVNEAALQTTLEAHKIAGAAVDVFAEEPPQRRHPFFSLDNILVTPHMAAMSDGSLLRMARDVAKGVADTLLGVRPQYLVNPEIWNWQHGEPSPA